MESRNQKPKKVGSEVVAQSKDLCSVCKKSCHPSQSRIIKEPQQLKCTECEQQELVLNLLIQLDLLDRSLSSKSRREAQNMSRKEGNPDIIDNGRVLRSGNRRLTLTQVEPCPPIKQQTRYELRKRK